MKCPLCGSAFTLKGKAQKYCGRFCARKAWRTSPKGRASNAPSRQRWRAKSREYMRDYLRKYRPLWQKANRSRLYKWQAERYWSSEDVRIAACETAFLGSVAKKYGDQLTPELLERLRLLRDYRRKLASGANQRRKERRMSEILLDRCGRGGV
jgi:hypothetical protein